MSPSGSGGRIIEFWLDIVKVAQITLFDGFEGIKRVGIRLCCVVRGLDSIVEDNHHTAVLGIRRGSQSYSCKKIDGSIGGDRGCRSHGSDDDDRLREINGE